MAVRTLRLGALLVGVSTSVVWVSDALAQASAAEKTTAEALFDEGVKLMKSGNFQEACPKLENSQRVDAAVGTLLYLGECYERLGRPASAWATFREAQSSAEASGQTARARTAKQRVEKVEKDLAYLVIEVADATRSLPGLRITRGGIDAGTSIIGAPVPVDPGEVKIEVSAPGHQNYVVTVTVQPRSRQSMQVPALAAREEPKPVAAAEPAPLAAQPLSWSPASPAAPPPPAVEESSMSTLGVVGLVVAGAGLVTAGVGTFYGLRAMSEDKKADEGSCGVNICQERADFEHSDNAVSSAKIANVAIGVGSGLVVAGGLMFLFAPSSEPKQEGAFVRVTPRLGPGFAGIGLEGRL
jgi:serine/threonine-protein kinase